MRLIERLMQKEGLLNIGRYWQEVEN